MTPAKGVVLNLDMKLDHARCVEVMVKLDQAKDFLLSNKHALNVQDQEKKLPIRVLAVTGKERNKHQKDCL